LNFAILNTVDVINMSLGGPPDPLLEELLDRAVDQGIIVIAAWGEGKTPTFPASVSGVIAAGRTSNAPKGSIPAPSEDVISLAPQNEYRYVSGSSVATAHVAGVVALLLSAHPGLTAERVAKALQSAVGVEDGIPMLDACRALNALGTDSLSKTPVNCSREIPTNQLHTFSE
jgi:subtilisin family serine protease